MMLTPEEKAEITNALELYGNEDLAAENTDYSYALVAQVLSELDEEAATKPSRLLTLLADAITFPNPGMALSFFRTAKSIGRLTPATCKKLNAKGISQSLPITLYKKVSVNKTPLFTHKPPATRSTTCN